MTILEAIQEANPTECTLSFANIQEFQSFMDSFVFADYPINVVLPFTVNGTSNRNTGIRKAVVPLQGWIITRVSEDTNDYRTLAMETQYMEPMRDLAIEFINNLLQTSIIDHTVQSVTDTIKPEYMFLPTHLFGVSYSINLPVVQNLCSTALILTEEAGGFALE